MRTFDEDGFRRRAAVVCLGRGREQECTLLLVASSGTPHAWILPGGGIDPGETPLVAALREAHEEAGVVCEAGTQPAPIAVVSNHSRRTRTHLFVMDAVCTDSYLDAGTRERRWVPLCEAHTLLLAKPGEAVMFAAAAHALRWEQPPACWAALSERGGTQLCAARCSGSFDFAGSGFDVSLCDR